MLPAVQGDPGRLKVLRDKRGEREQAWKAGNRFCEARVN
jgi:hypothetical protein